MNKYQTTVLWLGLTLILLRYLTTGQRSLFHNLFGSSGSPSDASVITPAQEQSALLADVTNINVPPPPSTPAPKSQPPKNKPPANPHPIPPGGIRLV